MHTYTYEQDRGVNLSGGQRMRISLARAAYNLAPNVLLDDPLAALDALVGRRVFEDLILGELAGRTRLVVTNQIQYCGCPQVRIYVAVHLYVYMYIWIYIREKVYVWLVILRSSTHPGRHEGPAGQIENHVFTHGP
jgi:hypothetical protein